MFLGIEVTTTDEQALAAIDNFYAESLSTSITDVSASLLVHRYELLESDRHGGFGARLLVAITGDTLDLEALQAVVSDHPSAPEAWRSDTTVKWSLVYRHVADVGPASAPPYAIYLVGVNPPPGIDEEAKAAFVDFYTTVHVPEVAKRRHCTRATVYELDSELLPPKESSPHFFGAYEVADATAVVARHVGFGYKKGPTVWEKHKTPWRLWYRRLPD